MSRLLDLDKKEAEWQDEIKARLDKIVEYDNIIAEKQKFKQEALEQIEKRRLWIRTAREMCGLATSDLEEDVISTSYPERKSEEILKLYADLKIPEAVEKLLQKCSPERLTVTEMAKRLKAAGIKTESTDFRNVLQNRLFSMRKKQPKKYNWLEVEKEGGDNYYSYKN